jgi:hypothetical protein
MQGYSTYQWRRLCQFLPNCRPPRSHETKTGRPIPDLIPGSAIPPGVQCQWRVRVSSRHFQIAQRLLYSGGAGPFCVTSDALSLVGGEAMASLWADRGRIVKLRRSKRDQPNCRGRLNLSRYSWDSALTVANWIGALTGARSTVIRNPRNPNSPMLEMEHGELARFLALLSDTWMAQAPELQAKFQLDGLAAFQELLTAQRMAPHMPPMTEQKADAMLRTEDIPSPPIRRIGSSRRVPTLHTVLS